MDNEDTDQAALPYLTERQYRAGFVQAIERGEIPKCPVCGGPVGSVRRFYPRRPAPLGARAEFAPCWHQATLGHQARRRQA